MAKDVDFRKGLRSAYLPHEPVDTDPEGPSLTDQSMAEECDINAIMARYDVVGGFGLPPAVREPQYLDLTGVPSFHEANDLIIRATDAFMQLPASVRRRFGNDAGSFIAFAEDPKNLEQMREWGLAPPAAAPEKPQKAELLKQAEAPAGSPQQRPAGA